jgi:hypothetical protein
MSEIPFVNNLGDALQRAIVPETARRRRRLRGRPWRLALVLALVVAGAAGAAQTLLSSPTQRAAINGIGCYDGTGDSADGAFDVYGPSPIVACRRIYRAEHSALGRSDVTLIACVGGQGPLAMVFKADGNPDQCRRLGFSPLPTGYATAAADVATLDRAIVTAWRSADCIAPAALAQKLDGVLLRLHWSGWHAVAAPAATGAGPCGNVGFNGNGAADPSGSLIASNHTLMVFSGFSRSVTALMETLYPSLDRASAQRCYTVAALRRMAQTVVASHGLLVAFTDNRLPAGGGFGDARGGRYNAGCAIIGNVGLAADGRTVDVAINDRAAPLPPASASSGANGAGSPSAPSPAPGVQ